MDSVPKAAKINHCLRDEVRTNTAFASIFISR